MDFENDAVCEKIINEIELVFQNDSDLYALFDIVGDFQIFSLP